MSLMTQPQLLIHHRGLKVFEVYFDRVIVFVYLILTKSQIKHVFLTAPPPHVYIDTELPVIAPCTAIV